MESICILLESGYSYLDLSEAFGVRSLRFLKRINHGMEIPPKSLIVIMSIEAEKIKYLERLELNKKINKEVAKKLNLREETLRPFRDWVRPNKNELKCIFKILGTSSDAARLLGVSGRNVRKWIGEVEPIPYSIWAFLMVHVGVGIIWEMPNVIKENQQHGE